MAATMDNQWFVPGNDGQWQGGNESVWQNSANEGETWLNPGDGAPWPSPGHEGGSWLNPNQEGSPWLNPNQQGGTFLDPEEELNEPPLLEELGVDPALTLRRAVGVWYQDSATILGLGGTGDPDLAGPAAVALAVAAVALATGRANAVYLVSLAGLLMVWYLAGALGERPPSLVDVASALGYSLQPVAGLAATRLLPDPLGLSSTIPPFIAPLAATLAAGIGAFAASRALADASHARAARALLGYPCPDPNQAQQPLLVCTAHIHWDPEFCDVKLIQTMMLSNELRAILDQEAANLQCYQRPGHKVDSSAIQLLLCGDFNSLPDSGVIEFLTSGRVPADHKDFKSLAYKACLQKISGCEKTNEFIHSFKLSSAYSEDIMPFTNYTFDFKGIIDYIFYSKNSMTPLGLLGPLAPEWLRENKIVGCPHPHVPSDHFPLLVELEMIPTVPPTSNGLTVPRR